MKSFAAFAIAALLFSGCASTDVAPPGQGDDLDIEATVLAVYNVVSGPAGRRDWDRFEELFAPGAQLVVAGADGKTTVETPKQYAERWKPILNEKTWFERPAGMRVVREGSVAQVWSPYEGRAVATQEKADAHGVDSVQLVRIGGAWKVQSILRQPQ
jgi:hypothetical protein